jgi:hypothetical protein
VNHFFSSWRILLAPLVKFVRLRPVIIMLVSALYRPPSALSLSIFENHFCKVREAMGGDYYIESLYRIPSR